MIQPEFHDLAELAEVEASLNRRWPETKIDPSLARISALMESLGSPQRSYPAIHVAGTNGKTSVTRMIDALLTAFHRRTGRITSPHLQVATECISIAGVPITPRTYVQTYRALVPYLDLIDDRSLATNGPRMSKFEVLTALAYTAFAKAAVEVAIVETGMGGRWDATNVIDAAVAVITPIALDHTDYLGDTLTEIAGEKAGIIKKAPQSLGPTDPVTVLAGQDQEVTDVLLRAATEARTRVARQGSEFAVLKRRVTAGGQLLTLRGLGGAYPEFFLPLHGAHQASNAALALAAVEAFLGAGAERQLDAELVRVGFAAATTPGRLERVRWEPPVFVDAAHNPHGAAALAAALEEFNFQHLIGVVSVLADKDVAGLLVAFEPVFDVIVVTTNGSPRAMDSLSLAELAGTIFGEHRVRVHKHLPDAMAAAIELAEQNPSVEAISGTGVVVAGSVVTAGAARTLFGKEPE